ncbi:PREDICTED: uncharacterized protein LOC105456847 [Wasmannia auropunctata]|uniref:uncharacterized protein LOC105456847 n=1 Tax=Wasmannia auropunctata TaxID=64793 RepID=UPI0005EFEE8F|nr:PREDICTED: uncharacterized protein LOC105456847 [Wasmannia auropunctata]
MTGGTGKPSNLVRASFLALFAVCQLFALARACTPTVIWCSHESDYDPAYRSSSPLQRPELFERYLGLFNFTTTLVTNDLCIEDLKNHKVLSNATNGSKILYHPCVKALDILQNNYKTRTLDINDEHEVNMIFKDIDSNGCIVLTGKQCRYSYAERIKREALAANTTTEVRIKTDKVILYSAEPLLFKAADESEPVSLGQSNLNGASSRTEKDKDNKDKEVTILSVKFNTDKLGELTLEFYFPKSIGYYKLSKVTSQLAKGSDTLLTRRDISFPTRFSYHCSPKTVFAGNSTDLSITEMQLQVDHKNATFGDAYDCVGFTSIPIWTGIFVTLILGLIMIWALTMILDIRTMDRFDDPKGKTITISSAE